MQARQRELTGFFLGLLAVIMFAGSAPFTRMALESYSPWFITFGRAALATIGAVIALMIVRRPIGKKHRLPAAAAGILLVVIFPGMMALAFKTIPAAHGGVIMGMLPILTALTTRCDRSWRRSVRWCYTSISARSIPTSRGRP